MNERTYRQLNPRVIEARPRYARVRTALLIGLACTVSVLWWVLILGFIFWPNTGPH